MLAWRTILLTLTCLGLLLSATACSFEDQTPTPPVAVATSAPFSPAPMPASPSDLEGINRKLPEFWSMLNEKHSIRVMSSGLGKDHIQMTVRSYGDVERKLEDKDLNAIKETLYETFGMKFPIEVGARNCCGTPEVTGKITKKEQDRYLVIDETQKNGDSKDPMATWISLDEDAKLTLSGSNEAISADQLKVGKKIKAWTNGLMLTSYPGQTSVIKVEVMP